MTRWAIVLCLMGLLVFGCDEIDGDDDNGGDGNGTASFTNSFTGGFDESGFSENIYSFGCNVTIITTHSADSRVALHLVDVATGAVVITVVYTKSVENTPAVRYLPAGKYRLEVVSDDPWSVTIEGCIQTYVPDSTYIGCKPGCCEGRGGVDTCDCETGWCLCRDGSYSESCQCVCTGTDTDTGENGADTGEGG